MRSGSTTSLVLAAAVLVAVGTAGCGGPAPAPPAGSPPSGTAASGPAPGQAAAPAPSPAVIPGPDGLPPLPLGNPARPIEVIRTLYAYAAERPDILQYVPCFCGCERAGHVGNDDCFVAARDASGRVTEWDAHGMG